MKPNNRSVLKKQNLRKIKERIKKDVKVDKQISYNEFFNILKEYRINLKKHKANPEMIEHTKSIFNINLLNTRLNNLRYDERYYKRSFNEIETINNFYMKQKEMTIYTKYFIQEIEAIPKSQRSIDINLLKSLTLQSTFKVSSVFEKTFLAILKESQKTENLKEFYEVLRKGNNTLDKLFKMPMNN